MTKKKSAPTNTNARVIINSMDEVMHASMLPYSEHVILERALPRVEDGLKPVQRRILYTMLELNNTPDKPYRKSARIVGDCLGKYHPHGDSSVYEAMVRLAQPFNMSMTLVDGHGNFGSVDGDSAAAMRYTEARMTPLAMELLKDLDKDTVHFSLNFDDSLKEPDVLPGRFPNLLVNGASGIAVGLATNIPPHNLTEAINAVAAAIDNPQITIEELMKHMRCPDFPTGGYILESDEIATAYATGRGKLTLRAKTHIEELKNGKKLIVITELPFQINKAKLLTDILKLSQTKKASLSSVTDIRDESDRMGMRAVIELRRDADADAVLRYLLKHSALQTTFGVNMVAIAKGKPQLMNLKQVIDYYIEHQRTVTLNRIEYDLASLRKREHILEGLIIALLNLDEVIALIRASKTPKIAKANLVERFELTEAQAQAILDLRLQRLTNLEIEAIRKEYAQIKREIDQLQAIVDSPKKLMNLVKRELLAVRDAYPAERRTKLLSASPVIELPPETDLIPEEAVVAILADNKLRRIPKRNFNYELLAVEHPQYVFSTYTDAKLRLFTSTGQCLCISVADIPETKQSARPTVLSSLVHIEAADRVVSAFCDEFDGELLLCTTHGHVKRIKAEDAKSRQKNLSVIKLKGDEELQTVELVQDDSVLMISRRGMSIRFPMDSIPIMGRASTGVNGIKLDDGDSVVFASQVGDDGEILLVSDFGYMKRCFVFDYDIQNRYGKGVKTFDFKKNGSNGTHLVAAMRVTQPQSIMARTLRGTETSFYSDDVPIESKSGKGAPIVIALLDDRITEVLRT
ncbi:MAG: DNA topoisomerase (ATP-hydrolyzing) [Clostridia bacterium]|nr:DNA topoisomerase (ATP-hydrolyzing) [Clostridia bacterium]